MSRLGDIYTAMGTVIDGVSSVVKVFDRPPEVGPKDANLPCAIPEMPEPGEIEWSVSFDSRHHLVPWVVLVARGTDLSTVFDVVAPVYEDVTAAFQTHQQLGTEYVRSCVPVSYDLGAYQMYDDTFLGCRIVFRVKEKRAVSFS